MEVLQFRTYTIDDIYALPEGRRAELMDGQIYMMAPPNRIHQKILTYLLNIIANHITANKGWCEVYPAPFAVFLDKDDMNYFEPDISVICDKNKLDDKGCNGAPDWIIEITSPSNSLYDYIAKLSKYQKAGVREYWIVNPSRRIITVNSFENPDFAPGTYNFTDKVKVNIYNDFEIDFGKLEI